MNNKFKNAIALGGFIITAIISVIVLIFSNKDMGEVELLQVDTVISSGEEKSEIPEVEEKTVVVYILGAVQEPGIVRVKENTRLYEVLLLVGGATEDADLTKINLASNVHDEQKIMIPYRVTIEENEKDSVIISSSNSSFKSNLDSHEISMNIPEKSVEVNREDLGDVIPFEVDYGKDFFESYEEETNSMDDDTDKLVNINTAGESELITLKGIGSSTAKKIIDYRNEFGNFKTVEEIKKVKGIGDAKFEKIKDDITV